MAYIEGSLLKGEKIVFISKPHWVVFVPSMVIMVLALLVWVFGPVFFTASYNLNISLLRGYSFSQLIGVVAVLIALYSFCKAFVIFNSSEYGITNRRIVMKRGFVQRNVLELFIRRLEAVNISQTIAGRLFGYGTIVVIGTGGTRDYFMDIPYPTQFRQMIQQQMDHLMEEDRRTIDP